MINSLLNIEKYFLIEYTLFNCVNKFNIFFSDFLLSPMTPFLVIQLFSKLLLISSNAISSNNIFLSKNEIGIFFFSFFIYIT